MKYEVACKKEIKMLIKEVVQEELTNIKLKLLEELRVIMKGGDTRSPWKNAKKLQWCSEREEKRKYYNY